MATTQAASDDIATPTPAVAESESVSAADEPVRIVEVTSTDSAAVTIDEPSEEAEAKDDCQMDIEIQGSTTTVNVSWAEKNEESVSTEEKTSTGDQTSADNMNGNQPQSVAVGDAVDSTQEAPEVGGKRKVESTDESSPKKKPKLINDGFCILVSNLDSTKTVDEIKDSIASYFMSQSLLVQDIRVNQKKIYAYVDLASQLDLTKALTLNKQCILNKPVKIRKARVIEVCEEEVQEKKVKVKVPRSPLEKKKAKDARTLYVENLPFNMTKEEVFKLFPKACTARFLGGLEPPHRGVAFVEYPNAVMAERAKKSTDGVTAGGRVLEVRMVGEKVEVKAKVPAPPSKTLYVGNLHFKVHEKTIKKVFKKAITIGLPHKGGKLKGYAFVEFATVEEAEQAMKSSQNATILNRPIKIQFGEMKPQPVKPPIVLSSKSLMVRGLAAKTTPDTLKRAFEGAVSARVIAYKATKVSKGYGFVDFDSDESCKAAKESTVDCEIDGSQVTMEYARVAPEKVRPAPAEVLEGATAQPGGEVVEQTVVAEKEKKKRKRKGKRKGAGKPQEEVKQAQTV